MPGRAGGMKTLFLMAFGSVCLAFLLFSCRGEKVSNPERPSDTRMEIVSSEPVKKAVWEEEWEEILTKAKREGKVMIYGSFSPEARIALMEAFKKRFGIELEITVGRGSEISEKIIRENRTGLNLADISITGATSFLALIKPAGVLGKLEPLLILPEVKDTQKWWDKKLPFLDKDEQIFRFIAYVNPPITFNKNLAAAEEIRSMRDILNPKWKGKTVMSDPTVSGNGSNWFGVFGEVLLDMDFMRAVAKMEPVIVRDERLHADWIARGRYSIGIAASSDIVTEFLEAGAPLGEVIPVEGASITSGSGTVGALAKAPHPYASRLFINWLLSREGVTVFSKAMGRQSTREDVTTDFIPSTRVRQSGIRYVRTDDEEWRVGMPQRFEKARGIFGPLMR